MKNRHRCRKIDGSSSNNNMQQIKMLTASDGLSVNSEGSENNIKL